MRRKAISLLLALVMLFGTYTLSAVQASAAKTDIASTGYTVPGENLFAKKLAQLQQQYPNGSRFPGVYYEDGMAKAWTCHAYALIMLHEVFGINYYGEMFYKKIDYNMGTIYAGDMVRINYNSHSIFITQVTSTGYYFTDGNYDGANGVRWNGFYTKAEMASIFTYKVHVPGNKLKGTGSATPELTLSPPELESIIPSSAGITVTWKKVDEAASYRIYCKGGDIASWKAVGVTDATMFTYSAAQYDTEYTFTVRCVDVDGFLVSSYDKVGLSAVYRLDTPELLELAVYPDHMDLSWNPVENAGRYKVYYKPEGAEKWKSLAKVTQPGYSFTDGEAGVSYTFTVRCLSDVNDPISEYDQEGLTARYVTYDTQLATPQNITAVAANRQAAVTVGWDDVAGAGKYQVFAKRAGIDTGWKKVGVSSTNSFLHTDCTNDTIYTYTVRCIDDNGRFMSGYLKDGAQLHYYRFPSNQKAVKYDDDGRIEVSWDAVDGAACYALYVKDGEDAEWQLIDELFDTTSYLYDGCMDGVNYSFSVRACDGEGAPLSSYDDQGVSLTYSSTYWPRYYSAFISNRSYLDRRMPKYYQDVPVEFALYDLDGDDSPELISNTGSDQPGYGYYYVYTVEDGTVVYLGTIGEKFGCLFYNPDSEYCGLFCHAGSSGLYYVNYFTINDAALKRTRVFELYQQVVKGRSVYKKSIKTTDDALYQAYLGAVSENVVLPLGRQLLHVLPFDTADEIANVGWDVFSAQFPY